MKKMIVLMAVLSLALPMVAFAVTGECVNCHTMHASKQGALDGNGPNANLLRFDCLGCHAQSPAAGSKNWTLNGNLIPQVAHAETTTLAGGKFNQSSARKVHSVTDVTDGTISQTVALGENVDNNPPGIPSSGTHAGKFTSEGATKAFDMFTCAGARGCHGTRSQALVASTVTNGTGGNNWEVEARRTGMAAISGAHHANQTGAMVSDGYNNLTSEHNGAIVGAGYRFIPGLKGFENATRENVDETDHNEYYGVSNGFTQKATGCDACHVQDTAQSNTRAGFVSGIATPNHSMSGFCSTCHGNFHSAGGAGVNGDYVDNGVSGAFLRHPSDYIIPDRDDYGQYSLYDVTAPVARPSVETAVRTDVEPGVDMVMCLSCHVAHGSANDYLLRFDYTTMTAGGATTLGDAQLEGGCMACHGAKGVNP